MTHDELVEILRKIYNDPQYEEVGHKSITLILFGLHYADDLQEHNRSDIAEDATGYRSYGTEIYKGIRLANYAQIRPDVELL